jgi:predicted transcriptional regulator of viral defense system
LKRFPDFDTRRLVEWQNKGCIQKIINKFYSWTDRPVSEGRSFFTANRLCHNSYVSLWSALSWYGFIPEGVFQVFSVTTKQTHNFETSLGSFNYQHVKPDLFFGYRPVQSGQREFLMAEPEKALLDTFYLNPNIRDRLDIEGLRLNIEIIAEDCDLDRLALYAQAYQNKRVEKLSSLIIYYI